MTNQVTMSKTEYDHRLKMSYEDGYQKGLYDGIMEAAQNAMPQKRLVAVGNEDGFTDIDELVYSRTIAGFLAGTGRR